MSHPYDWSRLRGLLKRHATQIGWFPLASGQHSHYYIDARQVTLSSEGAALVGAGVLEVLEAYPEVTAVGGLTLGADPIVAATLALAGLLGMALGGFLVRKDSKTHGTGKLIEGPIGPGVTVAIVEDVTTTGASAIRAADAALALGCPVACVISILDRLEGASDAFAAIGIPFHPLLTIRDLGVEPRASR